MQPIEKPPAAPAATLAGNGLADAVVVAMLARLRSIRVLMETQPDGIDPFSAQAATLGRLLAMEAQLEARRPAGLAAGDVFYLD